MNNIKHGKYIKIFITIIFFTLFLAATLCKDDEFEISSYYRKMTENFEENQSNDDFESLYNSKNIVETENYKIIIEKLEKNKEEYILDNAKSMIKISKNCLTSLVKEYSLEIDKLFLFAFLEKSNNQLIYFAIKQKNNKKLILKSNNNHFFICNSEPIIYSNSFDIFANKKINNNDIDSEKIISAFEKKIDLFNYTNEFFHDICYKFSFNETDLTLNERENLFFQNVCNISRGAVYFGYIFDNISNILTYKCAYGYFKNNNEKKNYIQNYNKINKYVKYNNKIIKCYKRIFKENDMLKNYGSIICLYILILQIIFFVLFIVFGISILKEKLSLKSKSNTNNIIQNRTNNNINDNINNSPNIKREIKSPKNKKIKSKNKQPINNFTNAIVNEVTTQHIQLKSNCKKIILSKCNNENFQKKKINANPPLKFAIKKKVKKIKAQKFPVNKYNFDLEKDEQEFEFENIENNNNNKNNHKILINNYIDNNLSSAHIKQYGYSKNPNPNVKKTMKIIQNIKNNQKKDNGIIISSVSSSEKSQTDDSSKDCQDSSNLSFSEVKTNETKNICQYFWLIFQNNRVSINLISKKNDFNLTIIKISFILFFFPLCLTLTSLLLNNKHMEEIHEYKYQNKIIKIHKNGAVISICSSLICTVIMSLLKNLAINNLVQIDKNEKKKNEDIFKCAKIRIYFYYVITLMLLIFFFYYVTIFCVLFENTQLILIYFMIASWIWSIIYSVIICLVSALLVKISIEKHKSVLLKISKLLNLL